jgi:hypothetical protein
MFKPLVFKAFTQSEWRGGNEVSPNWHGFDRNYYRSKTNNYATSRSHSCHPVRAPFSRIYQLAEYRKEAGTSAATYRPEIRTDFPVFSGTGFCRDPVWSRGAGSVFACIRHGIYELIIFIYSLAGSLSAKRTFQGITFCPAGFFRPAVFFV